MRTIQEISAEKRQMHKIQSRLAMISLHFKAKENAWAIDPQKPDSFFEVLRQVKQVGYDGFETGFFNLRGSFDDPAETAQRIAAIGLAFFKVSGHPCLVPSMPRFFR